MFRNREIRPPHVRKISLHPIGFAAARINQPPHDLVRAVRIRVRRNHHQNELTTIDVVEIHQIVGLARVRTPHFQSVDLVDTTLRAADRVPVERNPRDRPNLSESADIRS